MSRIALGFAVLIGLTFMGAAAHSERMMHGAMDICQAIDDGESGIEGDFEYCCANEKAEYDDGLVIYGQRYCVACQIGTDNCHRSNVDRTTEDSLRTLQKALAIKTKKAPVTAN